MSTQFKISNKIIMIMFCFISIITTTGCAITSLVSMATQKAGSFSLKVPGLGKREDILNLAEEVGKDLGYKATGKSPNSITLSYKTPFITTMVAGIVRHYTISVIKSPDFSHTDISGYPDLPDYAQNQIRETSKKIKEIEETLTISVMSLGDFGAGGLKNAEKLANEFKDKLLAKTMIPRRQE